MVSNSEIWINITMGDLNLLEKSDTTAHSQQVCKPKQGIYVLGTGNSTCNICYDGEKILIYTLNGSMTSVIRHVYLEKKNQS